MDGALGMTTVFYSGTWDLFHVGHLRALEYARGLGDFLVVGVCTDEFVASYKGPPVIPFGDRLEIVAALRCVDVAVPFKSAVDLDAINAYHPDIRVIGPEYGRYEGQRRMREMLESRGLKHVIVPRTIGISSSLIKEACSNLWTKEQDLHSSR
jgi:cytidyltransferase-like protein